MRSDAAELYRRWWPVALRLARRWAPSDADAEDIAASALVAVIEDAPAGLSDASFKRLVVREVSRSRESSLAGSHLRRLKRVGILQVGVGETTANTTAERDAAAAERVTRELGPAGVAIFDGGGGGTAGPGASTSRRWRARGRAADAALAVDAAGVDPACAWAAPLIARAARRKATPEQMDRLLAHTAQCAHCEELLIDRRAVAQRWRIAGVLPGFALGGRLWRGLAARCAAHPVVTGAFAVGLAGATVTAFVVPQAPAPAGAVYQLQADAAARPAAGGAVSIVVDVTAAAGGVPEGSDTLMVVAPGCPPTTATTDASGRAVAQVICPAAGTRLVTVRDGHGVVTTVAVVSP